MTADLIAQLQENITELLSIRDCSPNTPWHGCEEQSYGNSDHYDGHPEAEEAALQSIFTALPGLFAALQQSQQEQARLEQEKQNLFAELAQCYRFTGADPDGNSDQMLAVYAVAEVKRLRESYDHATDDLFQAEADLQRSAAEVAALRSALEQLVDRWRAEAADSLAKWPLGGILSSEKLNQCADELLDLLTPKEPEI